MTAMAAALLAGAEDAAASMWCSSSRGSSPSCTTAGSCTSSAPRTARYSDGEATTILRYYCFYVICLAMNGTSEAFLHAVANENQLKQSNLLLFSAIYIVLNVVMIKSARAVGLIAANSFNMLLQITYSALFIKGYFKGSFSLRRCLPAGWGVLLISGLTTAFSDRMFLNRARFKQTLPIHMAIGIMCLGFSLLEIYRGEEQFLVSILKSFKGHVR